MNGKKIQTVVFGLVLMAAPVVHAREYTRYVYNCSIALAQEDVHHARVNLETFSVTYHITHADTGELVNPEMEILPTAGVDAAEWAIVESRIRTDLEKAVFTQEKGEIFFSSNFLLNYDGVFTMIRALGGKSLADADNLTLMRIVPSTQYEMRPDEQGRYVFNLGDEEVIDGPRGPSKHPRWVIQAHLPLAERDGLSFHISSECKSAKSGVY